MQQWYVQRCRVDRAWNPKHSVQGVSGKGVVVADIDWGFRTSHQELKRRIELTYNSIDGTKNVRQGCRQYHGTAVLGILGAEASGVGMVGFAYEANLWAIQAANDFETDPKFWFAAIDYVRRADSKGRRKVVCLEGGTSGNFNVEMDIAINKAIRDAIACGVAVCVAAGNGTHDAGLDDKGNPFCETGSILVGATVFDPEETVNKRASFSNWGARVVVSAPGDMGNDVSCSSGADNGYLNKFGGTSGATPKVAGVVALMLEANPGLAHSEIRDILRATGSHITNAKSKPIGTFLNAEAAVCEARSRTRGTC
jgi:subtilisin family serine protease